MNQFEGMYRGVENPVESVVVEVSLVVCNRVLGLGPDCESLLAKLRLNERALMIEAGGAMLG